LCPNLDSTGIDADWLWSGCLDTGIRPLFDIALWSKVDCTVSNDDFNSTGGVRQVPACQTRSQAVMYQQFPTNSLVGQGPKSQQLISN
jgi:hypothetical protein